MNRAGHWDNKELLDLCISGDEGAWKSFVERFAPLVFWAIKQKASRETASVNKSDIDDIFQQTFSRIWRNNRLNDVKNPNSISSWLIIVAQNTASDFIRKNRSSSRFSTLEEPPEGIASSPTNPRTEADSRQLYQTIEELVADLPLKERRIITLELFYDLKHREISKIMDMPINTVSTIIFRIKKGLREKLKRRGYDA